MRFVLSLALCFFASASADVYALSLKDVGRVHYFSAKAEGASVKNSKKLKKISKSKRGTPETPIVDERRKGSSSSQEIVKSHVGAGFFAELTKVISAIIECEQFDIKELDIDWSQEFFPYKDDPIENGWNLFFEPVYLRNEDSSCRVNRTIQRNSHFLHDQLCINHWMEYHKHLPYRQSINEVLKKHLKIKATILEQFLDIYEQHLNGYYCIGVHVRWGAAHTAESPKGTPTLENYISEISNSIKQNQTSKPLKIFLATDSQEVIAKFKKHFPEQLLFYLPIPRSVGRKESHLIYENAAYWISHPSEFHQKKPGYLGGVGVLLDCLLLSKCDVFIHSSSNIAEFVSFFSPHIQSVYIPKDSRTWPCRYGL